MTNWIEEELQELEAVSRRSAAPIPTPSSAHLLALYSDMVETREATDCPRLVKHCEDLGAILRRLEPNGYG